MWWPQVTIVRIQTQVFLNRLFIVKTLVRSVQFSHSVVLDSLWHHELQHARLPCPSPTPRARWNSLSPLSQWCHSTISPFVIPFSCLLSFPASGSFPMSQFFASGGQSTGAWASASVLPMNIQDWFPLGWTGWISLQSKGLSWVFSNTTVYFLVYFMVKILVLLLNIFYKKRIIFFFQALVKLFITF